MRRKKTKKTRASKSASTAPPPPSLRKKRAPKHLGKGKNSQSKDTDHICDGVEDDARRILSESDVTGDESQSEARDSASEDNDNSFDDDRDTQDLNSNGLGTNIPGGYRVSSDTSNAPWGFKIQELFGRVLPPAEAQEMSHILRQAMAEERAQAVREASIAKLDNYRAVIDLRRKDQRRHIGERYTATSTRMAALLSFDLENSNSDLLEELSISLGGDCASPSLPVDSLVQGRVTFEARSLHRIVTLARANMSAIKELRENLQMGTHRDGGWDVVHALMDKTGEFDAKYSNEQEIFERMREGKKRARLMAPAKKPTPTPRRKTAQRKRAASRGREPSRRRTPSPAQRESRPLGQCWTCGSQSHKANNCPKAGNTPLAKGGKAGKKP